MVVLHISHPHHFSWMVSPMHLMKTRVLLPPIQKLRIRFPRISHHGDNSDKGKGLGKQICERD
jgi:hypothetical protein